MADRFHFMSFSKTEDSEFISTTNPADLELLKEENDGNFGKGYDFSFQARLIVGQLTKQIGSMDVTKDICIPQGGEFRIGSLVALKDRFNLMDALMAVTSISGVDKEDLDELKEEIKVIINAAKEAEAKFGKKAVFLTW